MKAGLNLIDNFLWETFEIDWRTNIRKNAKNLEQEAHENPKFDELVKNYSLNLHFINRMKRDPGFKQYLIKEIENDDEVIVKLNNYIDVIERKYIGNSFNSLFNLDKFDAGSTNIELDKNLAYDFGTYKQKGAKDHKEIKIEFLKRRLQIAELEKKYDEKIAVESLLSEIENGFIGCYDLFQKNNFYQKKLTRTHNLLNSKGTRYIVENLSSFDIYLERNDSTTLNFIPEPESKLIHSILQTHPVKPQLEKKSIDRYAKFALNCLDICFVLWFESKNENQKLSILNCDYEFSLTDPDITRFVNLHGKQELVNLTTALYNSNYFFEAKMLYQYLYNDAETDAEKRVYISNGAVCCREIGEYDLAIHNHLDEYRMICEAEDELKDLITIFDGTIIGSKPNPHLQDVKHLKELQRLKAISSKNIAENYLNLGDEEKAGEYLNQVFDIAEEMDKELKINLYFNVACAYRRTHKNIEEFNLLKECQSLLKNIEDNDYKKKTEDDIYSRLKLYEAHNEGSLSENKGDILEELVFRDKVTFAEKFIEKADKLFGTFQFARAINYFKRANEILESNDLNFSIARCYFYLYLQNIGKKEKSRRIEHLINTKKYLAGIKSQDLLKRVNKDALLLRGFTSIVDGIETRDKVFLAIGVEQLKKYVMFIYSINSDTHDYIMASLKNW